MMKTATPQEETIQKARIQRTYQNMPARMLTGGLLALVTLTLFAPLSQAQDYERVYSARTHRYEYVPKKSLGSKIKTGVKDAWRAPAVKKGAVGAGIGLGAAALTERNLLKGSLVGAGVGAGMGLMDNSRYFNQHPLVRRAAKGTMLGAGAAAATGAAALWPAAAVGAAAGTGIHYIKNH